LTKLNMGRSHPVKRLFKKLNNRLRGKLWGERGREVRREGKKPLRRFSS